METIRDFILHAFKINLSDSELMKVLDWYEKDGKNVSEEDFFGELQNAIFTLFPDKDHALLEEDMSDIAVIIAALDKATKK